MISEVALMLFILTLILSLFMSMFLVLLSILLKFKFVLDIRFEIPTEFVLMFSMF